MEKKLFCPNCGTQLPSSAKFCNKCGCSIPSNENANSVQNTSTIEPNVNAESKQIESVADNSSMDKEEQPKPLFSVSNIVRWVIVTIVALMINDGGIGGFVLAALCIGVDVLIRVFQSKYKWSLVKSSIIATLIGLTVYFALGGSAAVGESYNGNIEHDAQIFYEKIYEDGEDVEEVMTDYAVKEGYGMFQAEAVLDATQVIWKQKNM